MGLRADDYCRVFSPRLREGSVEFPAGGRFAPKHSPFNRDQDQVPGFGGMVEFSIYWNLVGPFSGLMRKAILKQAKADAELTLEGDS